MSCFPTLIKEKNSFKKSEYSGFAVYTFDKFKILHVKRAWKGNENGKFYLLSREKINICPQLLHIQTPVKKVVSFSTTHIPAFQYMNEEEKLTGIVGQKYVFNKKIRELIRNKKIPELGNPPNVEKVISINPDLILGYVISSPVLEGVQPFFDLKLPLVLVSDHLTKGPLERSEWMIFISYFFEKEKEMAMLHRKIIEDYKSLASKIQNKKKSVPVLIGSNFNGTWGAPGGRSDFAKIVKDAGGDYVWKENSSISTIYKSFETVLSKSRNSQIWLPQNNWNSLKNIKDTDKRYQYINAAQKGTVYNNNSKLNEYGGNDYWELGVMRPDLLLKDLIKIFHPKVLPNHELVWFRILK